MALVLGNLTKWPKNQRQMSVRGLVSYFSLRSYSFTNSTLLSSVTVRMYPFQPGHQLICHRQALPRSDVGLLSYLARSLQVSHEDSLIIPPMIVWVRSKTVILIEINGDLTQSFFLIFPLFQKLPQESRHHVPVLKIFSLFQFYEIVPPDFCQNGQIVN